MLPQSQPKKPKNSSKANLIISAIFHAILVGVLIYFAARQGWIGKKMQKIAVEMVKEKQPEPPKQKPEPPKVQPPKETPKPVEQPKVVETPKAPPPQTQPVVAPPAVQVPGFDFAGGAAVQTSSDPVQLYKGYMEYLLRSKWDRPDNLDDEKYAVEVRVKVEHDGRIQETKWLEGSGNAKWDDSVKQVFQIVKNIGRPPPTNFPSQVTIRFDVAEETESVLQ
jgi:TonB family protein